MSKDTLVLRTDRLCFPLARSWRSRQAVAPSALMAVRRGQSKSAAPHTYCGAVGTWMTMAANPCDEFRRPRSTSDSGKARAAERGHHLQWRGGIRRGVGRCPTSGMHSLLAQ
jgi:hypothetical protein